MGMGMGMSESMALWVERGRSRGLGMGVRIERPQRVPGELIARLQGIDQGVWFHYRLGFHGDLAACHTGEVETWNVPIVRLCLGRGRILSLGRPRLALGGAALPSKFQNGHGQLLHVFPQVDRQLLPGATIISAEAAWLLRRGVLSGVLAFLDQPIDYLRRAITESLALGSFGVRQFMLANQVLDKVVLTVALVCTVLV